MKLLIADDTRTVLDLEKTFLNRAECEVVTAQSGSQAVKLAHETSPDLVILDVEMPEMDGLQATRLLARDPRTKKTPIVLLSSSEKEKEALSAGAKAFYKKPQDEGSFLAMVRSFVPLEVRNDPRLPLSTPCTFQGKRARGAGEVANLSRTGIFMVTDDPIALGNRVELSFVLPDETPLALDSFVVRTAPPRGYGLGFLSLTPEQESALARYLPESPPS